MKLISSITIAIILALVVSIFPAAADNPYAVTITSPMTRLSNGYGIGTFTAEGPAVEAGIICPTGTVEDLLHRQVADQNDSVIVLFVQKQFVCGDGSGAFEIDLNLIIKDGVVDGRWKIMNGSNLTVNFSGNGSFSTYGVDPDHGVDTFSGDLVSH